MLKIGIVGAENSHTAAIAKTINTDGLIPDAQVTGIWGEMPEFAQAAADKGQILQIVGQPEDFIGEVDGVVVDHRHPVEHLPAAMPLLEAKIPLFIDKPFCYRVGEGKAFLSRAKELDVPITSFSVLPKQASFLKLKKQAEALGTISSVVTTGPCDVHSPYGGVFFYGIHQVDMLLRLTGYDAVEANVNRGSGDNHIATIRFSSGMVAAMNLIRGGSPAFHVSVIGENGRLDAEITYDQNNYLSGIQEFVHMFRTREVSETDASILGPVAVLQALEVSIENKGPADVEL